MPDAEVALVCGAAGALGSALVAAFSARGDRVVAVDRDAPEAGGGVRAEAADLTSADDVESLWSRLEADGLRPSWVVNAVGGFRTGTVADSDPDSLRLMLDLNLGTAWWSCRSAARRLDAGGAIVNVSARAALAGGSGSAAYAVAKAAVVRLTQALALELADRGVRANVLLPSLIETPANRASMPPEQMAKAVPPAEIAAVAAFLCSAASAPISGAAIPVYGRA
jgi:NAD(P)-dependent dehydrogenase (short-subunit alcohol dehydrogenase family)